jgi:NAD(P)-dependent dehydrogenase (short-subunit alcohol dehydrogenase family)
MSGEGVSGRVTIVTGGAQGIGRAICEQFAEAGASVVVWDVDEAATAEVVGAIRGAGGNAIPVLADATNARAVRSAVAAVRTQLGRPSIVINNVGGGSLSQGIEIDEAEWDQQIAFNLKTCYLVTHEVWPDLVEQGGGVVINAASLAASVPQQGLIAYCTAKAGVVMLTKYLAQQGGPLGIRVNAVAPGWTRTRTQVAWIQAQPDPVAAAQEVGARALLGRTGAPSEVAAGYLYLASDSAAWITGHVLEVDGGASLVPVQ